MSLSEALVKAQADMKNAAMSKTNPHFKSKYAPLDAVRDAVIPVLAKHGIALTQTTGFVGEHFCLITTLRMGEETIEGHYPIAIEKPQQMGSALTYARRYTLAAIAGIAAEEDDDGNAAQDQTVRKTAAAAKKDGDYERIKAEIEDCDTMRKLQGCWKTNWPQIQILPKSFEVEITKLKDVKKAELEGDKYGPSKDRIDAAGLKDEVIAQLSDCFDLEAITEVEDMYAQQLGDMAEEFPDLHEVVQGKIEERKGEVK